MIQSDRAILILIEYATSEDADETVQIRTVSSEHALFRTYDLET